MALEAVVFPQEHVAWTAKVAVTTHPPSLGCSIGIDEFEEKGGVVLQEEAGAMAHGAGAGATTTTTAWDAAAHACSIAPTGAVEEHWDEKARHPVSPPPPAVPPTRAASGRGKAAAARRKRRRLKAAKNTEETENQRRNHIAVERNRRRQMNEYLAVLRSAMPPSYAQRGDQASIVAGAINFVKELEQLLQSLEAQKRRARCCQPAGAPFAGFFTFPQYSAGAGAGGSGAGSGDRVESGSCGAPRRGVADVEVAVAESHANVKVLAPRRPKQLLRMVVALQCLGLAVLHLTATAATAYHLVFYSFSLKMEDECRLSSADEIAAAVHQMVAEIAEDRGS